MADREPEPGAAEPAPRRIVDEPERHLDQDWVEVCCAQLRDIADQGSVVLVATHSPVVRDSCDDILSIGA